jgi:hypothetical protein
MSQAMRELKVHEVENVAAGCACGSGCGCDPCLADYIFVPAGTSDFSSSGRVIQAVNYDRYLPSRLFQ